MCPVFGYGTVSTYSFTSMLEVVSIGIAHKEPNGVTLLDTLLLLQLRKKSHWIQGEEIAFSHYVTSFNVTYSLLFDLISICIVSVEINSL